MTLPASYTVEAALVMPVVLLSVVLVIGAGFTLHDIVLGNLTANETAELYGHLPEDGDTQAIESYGNTRLSALLSGLGCSLEIEEFRDGSRAVLSFEDGSREYEDGGSRPEKLMRRLTLLDALKE